MRSVGGVYNKFGKHLPLLSRPVTCDDDDNDDYYYTIIIIMEALEDLPCISLTMKRTRLCYNSRCRLSGMISQRRTEDIMVAKFAVSRRSLIRLWVRKVKGQRH